MPDIKDLIAQMTLNEKIGMCSGLNFWYLKGVERLGIPSIMVTDGPHGLCKQQGDQTTAGKLEIIPATSFPTASALAATWNRELIYQVGVALGEECRQEGVGVILGPGANIKRSPLCGRNFEYFSEDPYLTGEIAKSHIQGVQSQGIGTALKHYAVNNQEYRRMLIDAVVDERALREIYLAGFEIAVKEAQPWTVMGAYNKVNGIYACEHPGLLRDILKNEWGYEGMVMTDWSAINDPVESLKAGLELEMPGVQNDNPARIKNALESGELEEIILDQAVERILDLIFKARKTLERKFIYDPDAHHQLAKQAAAEGAVLLKNQDKTLPLDPGMKIALLGDMAVKPRYQGAGSSLMNPSRLDTIFDQMAAICGEERISYSPGYSDRGLETDQSLIAAAVAAAQEADLVVICAGLPESYEIEGLDREHLGIPKSHNQLIEAICEVHERVVVVLSNGAPVEMPWIDRVQAVLEGYLSGQAGAGAIAEILYGITNPSGKLAETFPVKLEDTPSYLYFPGGPSTVEYRESIYVGYRFYDLQEREVLFPFGHGLSYTSFEYRELRFDQDLIRDPQALTVSFRIKNTGDRAGKETAQIYLSPLNATAFRPVKELKGFIKVELQPGEEKLVSAVLERRAFAYFNTDLGSWHVESGDYQILVGASSRDIRLTGVVKAESSQPDLAIPERDRLADYRDYPASGRIQAEAFSKLLGRELPPNQSTRKGTHTIQSPLGDMQDTLIGRLLYLYAVREVKRRYRDDPTNPNFQMDLSIVKTMPVRSLLAAGGFKINTKTMQGWMEIINGRFLTGLKIIFQK